MTWFLEVNLVCFFDLLKHVFIDNGYEGGGGGGLLKIEMCASYDIIH
jgi:hypothetical protein